MEPRWDPDWTTRPPDHPTTTQATAPSPPPYKQDNQHFRAPASLSQQQKTSSQMSHSAMRWQQYVAALDSRKQSDLAVLESGWSAFVLRSSGRQGGYQLRGMYVLKAPGRAAVTVVEPALTVMKPFLQMVRADALQQLFGFCFRGLQAVAPGMIQEIVSAIWAACHKKTRLALIEDYNLRGTMKHCMHGDSTKTDTNVVSVVLEGLAASVSFQALQLVRKRIWMEYMLSDEFASLRTEWARRVRDVRGDIDEPMNTDATTTATTTTTTATATTVAPDLTEAASSLASAVSAAAASVASAASSLASAASGVPARPIEPIKPTSPPQAVMPTSSSQKTRAPSASPKRRACRAG